MIEHLICPICHSALILKKGNYSCTGEASSHTFPIVDGTPILINDSASIFKISNFVKDNGKYFAQRKKSRLIQLISGLLPTVSISFISKINFRRFYKLVLRKKKRARVLVIGSGFNKYKLRDIPEGKKIDLTRTDVYFCPDIDLICDAHNLPFKNNLFDGVIAQAVVEHLVNPEVAVNEIHRVLTRGGWAYFETAFMQQNHGGKYDFKRYTFRGHVNLLSKFKSNNGGVVCGPAMALTWSWLFFLNSFSNYEIARYIVRFFVSITFFWVKYLDYFLIKNESSKDAASGFYFFAQK